jgi:hypothetical protein
VFVPLKDKDRKFLRVCAASCGRLRPDPDRRAAVSATIGHARDCKAVTQAVLWQVKAAAQAKARCVCPDGQAAPYVRSYVLKDGRLFLSLQADGGIYEFEAAK